MFDGACSQRYIVQGGHFRTSDDARCFWVVDIITGLGVAGPLTLEEAMQQCSNRNWEWQRQQEILRQQRWGEQAG